MLNVLHLGVKAAHKSLCYLQKALHVRCLQTFEDEFGIKRKNGEEWLITMNDAETHIPDVYEEVR